MKKTDKPHDHGDDLRPEYDFRGGVRGKYVKRLREGSNVVQALRTFLKDRAKR